MKIAKTVQNWAAGIFAVSVAILTLISILGIWNFFGSDVVGKSLETCGLLAIVAVIVMIAGHFVGGQDDPNMIVAPNPMFAAIRRITLGVLIVAAALLALLGVGTIWDVITDKLILGRAVSSLVLLAFSSFVIVLTCISREENPRFKAHARLTTGGIIGLVILGLLLVPFLLGVIGAATHY